MVEGAIYWVGDFYISWELALPPTDSLRPPRVLSNQRLCLAEEGGEGGGLLPYQLCLSILSLLGCVCPCHDGHIRTMYNI